MASVNGKSKRDPCGGLKRDPGLWGTGRLEGSWQRPVGAVTTVLQAPCARGGASLLGVDEAVRDAPASVIVLSCFGGGLLSLLRWVAS